MRRTTGRTAKTALALIALMLTVPAAEAARDASVGGTVVDEEGNALEGVEVTVFSEYETRTDTTNRKGRFRVLVTDATQPFEIRLEKEGYVTVERPIQLRVGANINTSWEMVPTSSAAEVSGSGAAIEAYNAGAAAYNEQRYEEATGHFETALELDPELDEAWQVLTLAYYQAGDWEGAVGAAETLLERRAADTAVLTIGFDAASQLGRHDRAEVFLERLVEGGSSAEVATRIYNHGVAEMRAGERQAAVERFEQAIAMDPTLGAAYNGLASVYLEDERYDEALAMADRLLAADPGNAEALGIRYEVYRRQGNEAKMEEALDELQAADPERIVEAYYKQGMLLFENGQAEDAVEAFQRVLRAAPDHPRAHYQIGRAYLSAQQLDEAKRHFERFLELAPDDPEAATAREMLSYLD